MKKALFYLIITTLVVLQSCKTKETTLDEMLDLSKPSVVSVWQGSFLSANNYTTTGTAKIVVEDGKRMLVLENFKTTPGPDLKIYVATGTNPTDFVDLGALKASTGTFAYEITPSLDIEKRNHVLIWCKQFSRLFGSAVMVKQ